MTETQTVPVTLRLSEEVVEELKIKARSASFEENRDISYVDLIRSAIGKQYGIEEKDGEFVLSSNEDPDLAYFRDTREFWTPQQIKDFEQTVRGKMLKECIDKEEYGPYVSLSNRALTKHLDRGLAKKLLISGKAGSQDEIYRVCRDMPNIASPIRRRSAIPECIMEREEILMNDNTIGTAPSLKEREISPMSLQSVMSNSVQAFGYELDTQVLHCLYEAAKIRKEQIIYSSYFDAQAIIKAFASVAQHRIVPSQIILNQNEYIGLRSLGSEFLKAPPLKVALETKNYGTIQGVPLEVTSRAANNRIIICGPKHQVGVLKEVKKPTVKYKSDLSSGKHHFVYSGDYGFLIVNDYSISVIEKITD